MHNLRIMHGIDWQGNRYTLAMYEDADGWPRTTQLNGHVSVDAVRLSVRNYRNKTSKFAIL